MGCSSCACGPSAAPLMPAPTPATHHTTTAAPQVLDVKLPFDEAALLAENIAYLLRTLKLEALEVRSASDAAAAEGKAVDLSQAYPGAPVPYFC